MNTETGEIINPELYRLLKEKEPEKAKPFVEIPDEFLDEMTYMNRKERRAFYRKHKKEWEKILANRKEAKP